MYIATRYSSRKIFHIPGCHHIVRKNEDDMFSFKDMKTALITGYHPCADCLKQQKQFDGNNKSIRRFAADNNISWDVNDDHIQITSRLSSWKLIREGDVYRLFHSNNNGLSRIGAEIPGYHDQRVALTTVEEYFKYIASHDEYRKANPSKPTKRKGTPGYKHQQQTLDGKKKHKKVVNVYRIIDSLSTGCFQARSVSTFACVQ